MKLMRTQAGDGCGSARLCAGAVDRRGLALVELAAVLVIGLLVLVMLSITMSDSRRRSMLNGSLNNLKRLGVGIADYGLDNEGRVATFTAQRGVVIRCEDGYNNGVASFDVDAGAMQAVCIMRRLTGRTDIVRGSGWIPHTIFWHLPLMEYLNEPLPSAVTASPGDGTRLAWQEAVRRPNPGVSYFQLSRRPAGNSTSDYRFPYSSSYQMPAGFFSPDALMNGVPTVAQGSTHSTYEAGTTATDLGRRMLSEVSFPSQKAMLFEQYARFFGPRELYFGYSEARVPVLTADGGAAVRSTSQTNRGFQPNSPQSAASTRINYTPDLAWEPPTASGASSEYVNGGMAWTRSGLRGRDFDGPEVPWVP